MKTTFFLLITLLLGTPKLFCQVLPDTVVDIDGNVYHTVKIGTQVWMVENLKTTHYRNGDSIMYVTVNRTWAFLSEGAYCNYNNDTNNVKTYGRLYNWYAVTDSSKICPVGWHLPTHFEWDNLINFLGGENIAGDKLKSIDGWDEPNGATNSSGFAALPGGTRSSIKGTYSSKGSSCYFWSDDWVEAGDVYVRYLQHDLSYTDIYLDHKGNGYSVRCIKDY